MRVRTLAVSKFILICMMIRILVVVVGSLYLLTSCQREISTELGNNSNEDSNSLWVVVHKKVESFDTAAGAIPFVVKAGYFYDTATRTVSYLDTASYNDDPATFTHQYNHIYDQQGRLIRSVFEGEGARTEANLQYDADGLLQKVSTGTDANFTWTQQGNDLLGESRDPADGGAPLSDGNKDFTLNSDRKLMKIVHISADPAAFPNIVDEVTRDAGGSVTLKKTYQVQNGEYLYLDSILYTRDQVHEPRLSRFYAMLGNGIEWYSDYYGIRFIASPSWYSEYFEFDQSLCNKVVYYTTYKDVNGQWQTVKAIEINFTTEYDINGNPIKQTEFIDGVKVREIIFRWQKMKWLNN